MSNLWDWIAHFADKLEVAILNLAESFWIFPAIFGVSFLDAVFPVVPSESAVIASATAWKQVGVPWLPGIWLAAVIGAFLGDQFTYWVGSKVGLTRWSWFRKPAVKKTLLWAEHALEKRGTSFIIAARFIPMGRIAVNLSAGALGYPRRRFVAVDAIAVAIWATWGVSLGVFAGSIFHDNLLLSVVVGVTGGVILGMLVDVVLQKLGFSEANLPEIVTEADVAEAEALAEVERARDKGDERKKS